MSWVCPHCNHAAAIRNDDITLVYFDLEDVQTEYRYKFSGTKCPNPDCLKIVISFKINELNYVGDRAFERPSLINQIIIPQRDTPRAKKYPNYIPAPILQDYSEACAIIDLSPKSSATLARRALQGMIRDFWEVKENNLSKAIKAIEDKVNPDIWEAIDGLRKIGNIGAHMEKDINLIIDVSPEEADLLIEMIEMLLDDWYVARYDRQQRIIKMKELTLAKSSAKKPDSSQSPI